MKKQHLLILVFIAFTTLKAQVLNERPSFGIKVWANSIGDAMRSNLTHSEVIKYPPIIKISNGGVDWKVGDRSFHFPYKSYDKSEEVYSFTDVEINEMTIPKRVSGLIMEDDGNTIISLLYPQKGDSYGMVYSEMYVFEQSIDNLFISNGTKSTATRKTYNYKKIFRYNNQEGIVEWDKRDASSSNLFLDVGNDYIISGLPGLYNKKWEVIESVSNVDKDYSNMTNYQTTEMGGGLYVFIVNYGEYAVIAFRNEGLYILTNKTKVDVVHLFRKKFYKLVN